MCLFVYSVVISVRGYAQVSYRSRLACVCTSGIGEGLLSVCCFMTLLVTSLVFYVYTPVLGQAVDLIGLLKKIHIISFFF